jgi:hypothetical protein
MYGMILLVCCPKCFSLSSVTEMISGLMLWNSVSTSTFISQQAQDIKFLGV